MREWLSGIASPCQGEGRGFDSRFALYEAFVSQRLFFCFKLNCVVIILNVLYNTNNMREWLSGIASPSQGEGCGFDSRFALLK